MISKFEIRNEKGHYVVYIGGNFWGSYDSFYEAIKDLEKEITHQKHAS